MRVLQLVSTFGTTGGIESFVMRFSERLEADGHATVVAASWLGEEGRDLARQTPYTVVEIPGFVRPFSQCDATAEEAVRRFAARFEPDVVISHHTASARLLTALNRCHPTVEVVHTLLCAGAKLFRRGDRVCTHRVGPRCLFDWYAGPCGPVRSPLIAARSYQRTIRQIRMLHKLDGAIVGSQFMRRYLEQEGVPRERIHVADFTTGIDTARETHHQRAETGDDRNVLFVGRLAHNKGVQYALNALTLLDDSYRLTVVGDGFYREELCKLAATLGVDRRVEFTGALHGADLVARYRRARIAVVPSLVPEPVGLVVPEAFAHGLPVVAFDVGGLGEWRRAGSIYLAPPADSTSLAREIERACAESGTTSAAGRGQSAPAVVDVIERIVCERMRGLIGATTVRA